MTDFFPGVTPQALIPGDPEELLGLAGRLNALADGFDASGRELQRVDPGAWRGDAAAAFQGTIGQLPPRYFLAAQSFTFAATTISRYASVLEACQQGAARAIGSFEEAQTASAGWQQRQQLAQAACQPFIEVDPGVDGRAQAEALLAAARSVLDQAAATVNANLESAASVAPQKPGLFADQLNAWWDKAATPVGMFATPADMLNATSKWRVAQLLKTWNAYEEAVSPAVASEGEASLGALNAKLAWEEGHPMAPSRFATILEGAGDDSKYLESLGSYAEVADTIGKVTPVVGLIGGPIEFFDPKHSHGPLMVADRAAAAGTFFGSGAMLVATTGLLATPGLEEVGLAVVLVAGVWELYENRAEVARLTVAGGKFIANHAYILAGPAGIAAKEAWDYRRPLAHALVSTADTGKDLAENGAKTIVSSAASAANSAVSTTKNLLGHVDDIHVGGLHLP